MVCRHPIILFIISFVFCFTLEVSPHSKAVRRFLSRQYEEPFLKGKRISLTLKRADIRDVVALLGQNAGFSFLIDSDVKGLVQSIHLTDTSIAAALRTLLQSNQPQLALIRDNNLCRIVRASRAKNIFEQLEEFDIEHAMVSLCNASWTKERESQINSMWAGILGDERDNKSFYLVLDEDNRKIFFRGYRHHVREFKRFLSEIDKIVPQVKIEARFVCAEKGFEENIGMQWSGVYNRRSSIARGFDFVGGGRPLADINNNPKRQSGASLIDWALNFLPTPSKAVRALNIPFVFGGSDLQTKRLNLVLNAAESRNEIKTILKPVVLTNSREPAKILVGENVPIETVMEETIEGRLRNVKTATYKDIGIQLKVTPTVLPDKKTVILDIFIENSQQSDVVSTGQSIYPVIRTTRSQTRVRIESGQTAMISGLIKDVRELYNTKAPLLGELPLFGWLFRGKRNVIKDMQLLIFISPEVV